MTNTISRRGFLRLGLAGLLGAAGCATTSRISSVERVEEVIDAHYGAWESQNVEDYQPIGNGYFNAKLGKKEIKIGSVNLRYITLDKLAELSKDKEVEVCITEPEWCGGCFEDALELKKSGKDKEILYLTVKQAKQIDWKGQYIPEQAKVVNGKVK
jgi:hypothetical protein